MSSLLLSRQVAHYLTNDTGNNGVAIIRSAWEVGIPGKEKTIWEGGLFKLTLSFPDEYPTKPPKCETNRPRMHKERL